MILQEMYLIFMAHLKNLKNQSIKDSCIRNFKIQIHYPQKSQTQPNTLGAIIDGKEKISWSIHLNDP